MLASAVFVVSGLPRTPILRFLRYNKIVAKCAEKILQNDETQENRVETQENLVKLQEKKRTAEAAR